MKIRITKIYVFIFAILLVGGYFWLQKAGKSRTELVLGIEDRRLNSKNMSSFGNSQSACFSPVESAYASGFAPVKKIGYYDLKIWAGSSVAIDVDSKTLLFYDNGRKRTQIASLTKIMTAVLAIENIKNLEEEVAIPREAVFLPGTVVGCPTSGVCPSNRMYSGEKVKAMDLLKAMIMNSANDAAYSLAVHIAGSESKFVDMMNKKAEDLGLEDTHFCTASGLEIDGQENECYSSAYDIARIASTALDYNIIWKIMRISEDKFYSTDGKYMHELKNTDLLIQELSNCIGGKTGFTPLAGKSLMFAGTDLTGKHRVVMVILNDQQRWEDMRSLNSWVFENYEWR
jgi:serine-type D-Ala-D-Ala carboxypeptidase (penicillin-binding protein 5/6)